MHLNAYYGKIITKISCIQNIFNNNLLWLRLIQVWGNFYGKKKSGKTRRRKKAISNGKKTSNENRRIEFQPLREEVDTKIL